MTRIRGSTTKDVEDRQKSLIDIIDNFRTKGKPYTKKMILAELAKKGFHIDRRTLYRDGVEISREDSFVRDIAESTYSAMVRRCFDKLDDFDEQIDEWIREPPKIIRKTKIIDQHNHCLKTELVEQTISPTTILKLGVKVVEIRFSVMEGDTVDTSIALLHEEFKSMQEEIYKKDLEIAQLSKNTSIFAKPTS